MTTYVIADLHFGDAGLVGGGRSTARSAARAFPDSDTMDAEMIRRWNDLVGHRDVVFVLGDIGKGDDARKVALLNGVKHLVAGNGDDLLGLASMGLFATISVVRWLSGCILTHIPVHPSQIGRGAINVHGHLHGRTLADPRYVCASVEQTDYRPVALERITNTGYSSIAGAPSQPSFL